MDGIMAKIAENQKLSPNTKNEFNPDYPATIDDAIEMMVGMFEERAEENDELTKGYKAGLQMGIYILGTLKRVSGG